MRHKRSKKPMHKKHHSKQGGGRGKREIESSRTVHSKHSQNKSFFSGGSYF